MSFDRRTDPLGAGMVRDRPRYSPEQAEAIAGDRFGLRGRAEPLPAERDQNFRLVTEAGECFVLKVSRANEPAEQIACENRALAHLAAALPDHRFPETRAALSGRDVIELPGDGGASHRARLLAYVPGAPLTDARPHTPELLERLGAFLGRVDAALRDFDDPAADREFVWDLRNAGRVVRTGLEAVGDPERRARLEEAFGRADERIADRQGALRRSVIHNDANDHNVLVARSCLGDDPFGERRIVGLVDFGDLVRTWTVAELAIAIAYVMLGKPDPLTAAADVVRGYHRTFPLSEAEVEVLYPLALLRLSQSVAMSAMQRRVEPSNSYLSISEGPAWSLIERLRDVSPDLAHYTFREACGWEPCPGTARVVRWLEASADRIGPVLEPELQEAPKAVLDLGVGSPELAGLTDPRDLEGWMTLLDRRRKAEGWVVGIGRYREPRRWYATELFRVETNQGPGRRTIHLGLDLFVEAGTPVLAPLDGVVHSFGANRAPGDYGPTLILEHRPASDVPVFYTLYGHLAGSSIGGLRDGMTVSRGEKIGEVGHPGENGGWAPHLHFQVVVDMLGRRGDFPGAAVPGQLRLWSSLSPDPNRVLRLGAPGLAAERTDAAGVRKRRERHLGPTLSVSYRRPLVIVEGWMRHLYDAEGRAYLDCVNNVAHVGHSHPRVVDAIHRQAAVLNTNTRYLHEKLVEYAERLTARLPEPLRVCYLVCTGSEANELALRMARAQTAARDVVVVEGAYHGNTSSLIEISPYKFDGPGGAGAPDHVHVVPMPDPYRGRYRGSDREVGLRYARHVREAVEAAQARGGVAAFFCEPLLSCGGQIVPPDGFLPRAYAHVREAGGVCVADEVQIGFGRLGSHFWGFEAQGVVPDIVTMGKPMGNGHPVAAVVTTPEIAASFDTGMEYFNTFGGNPVACAAGLAVLDVIEEEGLQRRAREVGERFRSGLETLKERHPVVGDVRGLGLFLGVELVLDRESREPAAAQAAYVTERMKERGILLSTDGPARNVLKLKPPLVFNERDADRVVGALDEVLQDDVLRDDGRG